MGSKSEKDIKSIRPYVSKINAEFEKLKSISNDELRNKTVEIKGIIKNKLKAFDDKIASLREKALNDASLDIHQKDALFDDIDKVEEDRNKSLEDVLMEVLPSAFAVVKETARRFSENEKVEVTATDLDKEFAAIKEHVTIEGDKAYWSNSWKAAGVEVTWSMLHYDVQLIGGIVLHQGKIAEMATGEGKTLVATLPAYLNALAERGVHIVTVNDYLAKRDSEWMAPIFEFHGMKVDCIDKHTPHSFQRKEAYKADITYGTNNEFGFDYLRDNMVDKPEEMVQRKHHYAMVDEVDSVLVDDARTPLIISGPVPKGDQHEFYELKPGVAKLVEEQKKLVTGYLTEAKKLIKEGNEKEGGLSLFRAHRGLPKAKPLIKFLSETGMKSVLQKTENIYLAENQKLMPEADAPLFFTIDEKTNNVELTEKGMTLLSDGKGEDFFMLPDISIEMDKIDKDAALSDGEKVDKKDGVISDYSIKSQRIHSLNQLLKAYTMFEKDVEYIVDGGKVKIVDEQTGRVMDGRRYSDGLHQAIEAKENVKVEDATQTYATVTLQNYFRMYHKLAGMTGTAETEAGEFWEIYKLDVVVIPTNVPIKRDDKEDLVYKSVRAKFNGVIDEVVKLTEAGRPVLVGTTSVEISELLSRMLEIRKIKHQVLNAKQHAKEADVVAEAGKPGTVTIATNMAGRGTDIKLTPESKAAGGLAIIGTERHESRRVDRQLRGRAGRQGDVGSSQFFVSLEDNLMRLFGNDRIPKVMDRMGFKEDEVIQHSMITKSITRAQKKVEENNFAIRKRLLEYDDVMNNQREVIYTRRRNALFGERLQLDILNMIYEACEALIAEEKMSGDYSQFDIKVIRTLGLDTKITEQELEKGDVQKLTDKLYAEAVAHLNHKNKFLQEKTLPSFVNIKETRGDQVKNILVPFAGQGKNFPIVSDLQKIIDSEGKVLVEDLQKTVALSIIDDEWKEHLREMDDLKQSVQNATFEQKDPLLIYKFEGFELFQKLIDRINMATVSFLCTCDIKTEDPEKLEAARTNQAPSSPKVSEQKDEARSLTGGGVAAAPAQAPSRGGMGQAFTNTQEQKVIQPIAKQELPGRNDRVSVRYPDGSTKEGVKFKTVEEDVMTGRCVLID